MEWPLWDWGSFQCPYFVITGNDIQDFPLLDFALSVMVFAYSGLLGVYFTALFTNRGSIKSVKAALISGFVVTLLGQGYIIDLLNMPGNFKGYAFTWQLCIGTLISFLVCMIGKKNA